MREVITFKVCASHRKSEIHEGMKVGISTAVFENCAICGTFTNDIKYRVEATAELIYEEPCNCGDWIRHNDGGNYHWSEYRVVEIHEIERLPFEEDYAYYYDPYGEDNSDQGA